MSWKEFISDVWKVTFDTHSRAFNGNVQDIFLVIYVDTLTSVGIGITLYAGYNYVNW